MGIAPSLERYARNALSEYDESHDYNHSVRVWENAIKIKEIKELEGSQFLIVMYACFLHDVLDHKYTNKITEEELKRFITDELDAKSADIVIHIIKNISWSKRKSNVPLPTGDIMRKIVQDADWLDALGEVGVKRCIDFTKARGGKVPEDVLKHMEEKLLVMIDHFNFKSSRELAEPLHQYMVNWYNSHSTTSSNKNEV